MSAFFFTELQKRIITSLLGILLIIWAYVLNFLGWLLIPLTFFLLFELAMIYQKSPASLFKKLWVIVVGSFYCTLGISTLYWHIAAGRILSLMVSVWLIDSIAFFFGRWIKGSLLVPIISPKKTWSGFIMATIFGILWGPFLWFDMNLSSKTVFLSEILLRGCVFGALFAISVQIGDLFVSVGKRICKIKDSSSLLPGHGGFWDRCDSLFAGAIFTFFWFIGPNFITKLYVPLQSNFQKIFQEPNYLKQGILNLIYRLALTFWQTLNDFLQNFSIL